MTMDGFAKSCADRKSRNADGNILTSSLAGAGLNLVLFSDLAATAYYISLGDRTYLPSLLQSENHYRDAPYKHESVSGHLDIEKNIDSEGILAYIRGRYLHELM